MSCKNELPDLNSLLLSKEVLEIFVSDECWILSKRILRRTKAGSFSKSSMLDGDLNLSLNLRIKPILSCDFFNLSSSSNSLEKLVSKFESNSFPDFRV